jgi:hypothetical protein
MKVKKSPGLSVGTIILSEANLSRSWHRTGFSGQYLFVVSQGFFQQDLDWVGFSKDCSSAGFWIRLVFLRIVFQQDLDVLVFLRTVLQQDFGSFWFLDNWIGWFSSG